MIILHIFRSVSLVDDFHSAKLRFVKEIEKLRL